MKTNVNTLCVRTGAAVLSLGFCLTLSQPFFGGTAGAATVPKLKSQDSPVSRDIRPATSFAPIVKKVGPSVVNIYTTKTLRGSPQMSPLFEDPFFRRFFGVPEGEERMPRERREQSLGSGVIVTEDGYILTANHVVEGADEIKVVLADDKKEFDAKVIGTDPQTDTAVVKVEGKGLPAITVTDSDKIEVGDIVLAVGNPFGVGQTVTTGIVSGKGRGGMGIVDYEDFIQTDASINPGNSGGALVDAEGRLVGINTVILSPTGGNQGIGFAVPVNLIRYVMNQIVSEGKVTRGFLGVRIQAVTPELAREFKLPEQIGALVGEVTPNSPAAQAGLKEGDVIVEFNGKKVTGSRQLRLMASQSAPGTKADVKVLRDGKEQMFTVRLGELPAERLAKTGRSGEPGPGRKTELLGGVAVDDLDTSARRELNIPSQVRGALVLNVEPSSPAAAAGLRPGDVILEVNRKRVNNAEEAAKLSEQSTGERVLLRVWSEGGSRYAVVTAGRKR
jgi:serine protease Do